MSVRGSCSAAVVDRYGKIAGTAGAYQRQAEVLFACVMLRSETADPMYRRWRVAHEGRRTMREAGKIRNGRIQQRRARQKVGRVLTRHSSRQAACAWWWRARRESAAACAAGVMALSRSAGAMHAATSSAERRHVITMSAAELVCAQVPQRTAASRYMKTTTQRSTTCQRSALRYAMAEGVMRVIQLRSDGGSACAR